MASSMDLERSAPSSLSPEQERACSSTLLQYFSPATRPVREVPNLKNGECEKAFPFAKLPAEIKAMIMGKMDCYSLLSLLQLGENFKITFLTHSKSIFEKLQSNQFPEYHNVLGQMPGFLPEIGEEPVRTPLREDFMHYVIGRVDTGFAPLHLFDSEDVYRFANVGGWQYLAFLGSIRTYMHSEAEKLREYLLQCPTPDASLDSSIASVQLTMLCLCRMTWNSLDQDDAIETFSSVIEELVADVCPPGSVERELVSSVIGSVSADLASRMNFQPQFESWKSQYQSARATSTGPMLDDEGIHTFASKMVIAMTFQVVCSYDVFFTISVLDPKNEELDHDHFVDEFGAHLDDKLRADIAGTEHQVDHFALEGWLYAKELEYYRSVF